MDECLFQLPKLNKYCLEVELDPVHQVTKKLKMDHLWVITLYPRATETTTKKKQKGMPVTEMLNAFT